MRRQMRRLVGVMVLAATWACSQNPEAPRQLTDTGNTSPQIGTFVINPQFDLARGFSEGLAGVRIGDDKTGKWGFIAR